MVVFGWMKGTFDIGPLSAETSDPVSTPQRGRTSPAGRCHGQAPLRPADVQQLWLSVHSTAAAATLFERLDASPEWEYQNTYLSRYEFLWTRTWLYSYTAEGRSNFYCFPLYYDARTGVVIASPGFVTSGHLRPTDEAASAMGLQQLQAPRWCSPRPRG
jgi:hypothetical protein